MSINILLNEQGTEPLRYEDEYFILKRNDISYRITLESKINYDGEGYIILTSNRLVIFPKKQNTNFRAIEIPLNQIYSEEFKQPLFGKNHIKGSCRPFFQSQFGNFTFFIYFKGNKVGTLVGAFFTLIDSLRNNQGRNHSLNMMKDLKENNFNNVFAIDPEDISKIYQYQPPAANIPKQNFQSVIINRPNNINNNYNNIFRNNNGNFSRLNEEEINQNNNNGIYMSHFVYKNPNENFVYKDPGFVYKEPNYNNNVNNPNNNKNINVNNNVNNNINNYNAPNINNNFYYINNVSNNNVIKPEDDDDLVSPYNIQNKNNQNINQNIPPLVKFNSQHIIQNQNMNRNFHINNNNDNVNDLENPYKMNNINISINNNINQNNQQYNLGYPPQRNIIFQHQNNQYNNNQNIQNKQINQMNNPYNQIHGPINNNISKIIHTNNNKSNSSKYRQLSEEIPDESELNSKNQLTRDEFNESNIPFENNNDLSLISHKEDSLPNLSNIYPDI